MSYTVDDCELDHLVELLRDKAKYSADAIILRASADAIAAQKLRAESAEEDAARLRKFLDECPGPGCPLFRVRDRTAIGKVSPQLLIVELLDALRGVIRVADRKTDEFDAARAVIAKAEGKS